MEDGTIFSFTLVGGLLPVVAYFYPFVDGSFELCNNWLCTSLDVDAGFNYPISKKHLCWYQIDLRFERRE
jgi:hypothetical protein